MTKGLIACEIIKPLKYLNNKTSRENLTNSMQMGLTYLFVSSNLQKNILSVKQVVNFLLLIILKRFR